MNPNGPQLHEIGPTHSELEPKSSGFQTGPKHVEMGLKWAPINGPSLIQFTIHIEFVPLKSKIKPLCLLVSICLRIRQILWRPDLDKHIPSEYVFLIC